MIIWPSIITKSLKAKYFYFKHMSTSLTEEHSHSAIPSMKIQFTIIEFSVLQLKMFSFFSFPPNFLCMCNSARAIWGSQNTHSSSHSSILYCLHMYDCAVLLDLTVVSSDFNLLAWFQSHEFKAYDFSCMRKVTIIFEFLLNLVWI